MPFFSYANKNYFIHDCKLLVVKLTLEEWRHLMEGGKSSVTIYTNHKNLEYFQSAYRFKLPQPQWALFFSQFDFIRTYHSAEKSSNMPFPGPFIITVFFPEDPSHQPLLYSCFHHCYS